MEALDELRQWLSEMEGKCDACGEVHRVQPVQIDGGTGRLCNACIALAILVRRWYASGPIHVP